MNILRDSLVVLRTRFHLRLLASILFYAGYILLGFIDVRIALGVFLVLFAYSLESKMEAAG